MTRLSLSLLGLVSITTAVTAAISRIEVSDFVFPSGPSGSTGITTQTIASAHFYNDGAEPRVQWTFSDQKIVNITTEFHQSTTDNNAGVPTSFVGYIPSIDIGPNASFVWSRQAVNQTTTQQTQKVIRQLSQSGQIAGGQGVDCFALLGEGTGTYAYTSTVTLYNDDGSIDSFTEDGSLLLDTFSLPIVEIVEADHP